MSFLRLVSQNGGRFSLMDLPIISEDVLARMCSRFRVMQWLMVEDAGLQWR